MNKYESRKDTIAFFSEENNNDFNIRREEGQIFKTINFHNELSIFYNYILQFKNLTVIEYYDFSYTFKTF